MIKKIICILTFLSIIFASYSISNTDLYKTEFNSNGETCSLSFDSIYLTSMNKISKATTYVCCDENEKNCKILAFDTHNLIPFSIIDSKEIFTLDFIQEQIFSGDIDKDIYSVSNGFSSCEYLGYSAKLEQESINLGAIITDKGSHYLSENSKKMAKKLIWTGEKLGKIKKLNPGDFAIGVSCNSIVDDVKLSYEKLALCDSHLNSLRKNSAYYGLSYDLDYCNKEVLTQLEITLDSVTGTLMSAIDQVGSIFSGLSTWIKKLMNSDLGEVPQIEFEETVYDILKQVRKNIEKEDPDFSFSKSRELALSSNNYFLESHNKTSVSLIYAKNQFRLIDKRNEFEIFFINTFQNPNYNNSNISKQYLRGKEMLDNLDLFHQTYRFNSFNEQLDYFDSQLIVINELIEKEENIERNIDFLPIFIILLLFILYLAFQRD